MDRIILLFCLGAAAVYGQDAAGSEVKVAFEGPPSRYHHVGDKDVEFVWTVNQGIAFFVEASFNVARLSPSGTISKLYQRQSLDESASPEYYTEMDRIDEPEKAIFSFTIKEIRESDEGTMIVTVKQGDLEFQASVDIFIYRKISGMTMKFGANPEISASKDTPYEVDAGAHPVACTATGSNPAVENLKLYLNKQPLDVAVKSTKISGLDIISYESKVTTEVDIKVAHSGTTLECVAEQPFTVPEGEKQMMSITSPISVRNYDPVITCGAFRAYTGLLSPKLVCTVDHTNLDIKDFRYKIENADEKKDIELSVGETADDYTTVLSESMPNSNKTKVTLKIGATRDWHFTSEFFLIVENENGHITRTAVDLEEIPGYRRTSDPGNFASYVTASVMTFAISFLLATLVQL